MAGSLSSGSYPVEVLRDIEETLSEPRFRGVPLGPTLSDLCVIEFYSARGEWGAIAGWKDRARRVKHYVRPLVARQQATRLDPGRVLVTCSSDNFRERELVLPVVQEFRPDECSLLTKSPELLARLPAGVQGVLPQEAMRYDVRAWRVDYRRCRTDWQRRTRMLCRRHRLPPGAYDRIMLHMMFSSQSVAGFLEWFKMIRPATVLTEYDRHHLWSCLVLVARSLGVPTLTLVHGVLNEHAVGYTPVLANRVLCWGAHQREQFLAAGEHPEKVKIVGCPRLHRELDVTPAQARRKLGLTDDNRVVMLATTPRSQQACLGMAELFCTALAGLTGASGVVRLHPSERVKDYELVARRYPAVRFLDNGAATLDEALAAADLVVVPNSGFGSDALVKRRPVVVIDLPIMPLGHGADLIHRAGCPRNDGGRIVCGRAATPARWT